MKMQVAFWSGFGYDEDIYSLGEDKYGRKADYANL